jgi:ABC-type transport system involved in multi-copper enzyme maturation permease subunit
VFAVVLVLTAGFLLLYAVGAHFAFEDVHRFSGRANPIDATAFTGATVFGLAMFAGLFLGAVLAVFLTLGVVRGDAESGLLQPVVARPVGRATTLASRFAGAAAVAAACEVAIYAIALVLIDVISGWTPDHIVGPGLGLALAVVVIAALSLLGSVFFLATAQGIALFMVFGAGLTAGLLGEIGRVIDSEPLRQIAHYVSWALPFEGLYQAGLHALTSSTIGLTGFFLKLGPFGGAEAGDVGLVVWAGLYVAAILALSIALFARRDL